MAEDYAQMVEATPVELRGERMHMRCMTDAEKRMTVYFLNRQRMAGRTCERCGETVSLPSREQRLAKDTE